MKKYPIKQITILTLLLSILILTNCFDTYKEEDKKRNSDNRVALLQMIGLSWGTKEEGKVVDNRDGTLTYTYTLIQTNGWLGNRILNQRTILIRRCLIGQVYRQTQNDCQGAGTKETVWGASQLQWCPTNDRSCEKDGKADPTISPAAKACAEDKFVGKKWRMVNLADNLGKIFPLLSIQMINDLKNINDFRSPKFWLEESPSEERAWTINSVSGTPSENKNTLFPVLCKEV